MDTVLEKPKINRDALTYNNLVIAATLNHYILDEDNLPAYQQKSFYGKATVIKANKQDPIYKNIKYLLKSYDTIVAFITTNDQFFITKKYSQSTTKHQRAFAHYYCGQDIAAKELRNYIY